MAEETDEQTHDHSDDDAASGRRGVIRPGELGGAGVDQHTVRDIERLDRLLALGLLTREEYERAASRVLGE